MILNFLFIVFFVLFRERKLMFVFSGDIILVVSCFLGYIVKYLWIIWVRIVFFSVNFVGFFLSVGCFFVVGLECMVD